MLDGRVLNGYKDRFIVQAACFAGFCQLQEYYKIGAKWLISSKTDGFDHIGHY
jgi:hypothetical protein